LACHVELLPVLIGPDGDYRPRAPIVKVTCSGVASSHSASAARVTIPYAVFGFPRSHSLRLACWFSEPAGQLSLELSEYTQVRRMCFLRIMPLRVGDLAQAMPSRGGVGRAPRRSLDVRRRRSSGSLDASSRRMLSPTTFALLQRPPKIWHIGLQWCDRGEAYDSM